MGEIESRSSRFCGGGGGIEERGYFWPKSREQLANRKSKRKVIAAGCRLSQLALSAYLSLPASASVSPSLPPSSAENIDLRECSCCMPESVSVTDFCLTPITLARQAPRSPHTK